MTRRKKCALFFLAVQRERAGVRDLRLRKKLLTPVKASPEGCILPRHYTKSWHSGSLLGIAQCHCCVMKYATFPECLFHPMYKLIFLTTMLCLFSSSTWGQPMPPVTDSPEKVSDPPAHSDSIREADRLFTHG